MMRSTYKWEQVEGLLPGVWDTASVLSSREGMPDPDMPTAKADPSHGFEKVAQLADIKRAWELAPLTLRERQAALLTYGAGLTRRQAAPLMGCAFQVVDRHHGGAIEKILAFLNGIEYDREGVEDE